MPAKPEPIPITRPVFGARERELLLKPLETGWVVQGPYVAMFEKMFAAYVGSGHALAVSSCTTGLHLVLHALGVGPGDEVILPSFTYVATANAVEYCGARPVFCDIDLANFNIDVAAVEALITPRTRGLLAVSLFGLAADLPALAELASRRGLFLLEDAACALGATIQGRHTGAGCVASVYSLHPRKAITTGEGGMITTDDPALADLIGKLRNHGAEATDLERHHQQGGSLLPAFNLLGFNYRLTDLQGALGVAQMERLEDILAGRRAGAAAYDQMLADARAVAPPHVPPGHGHAYQSYVALYRGQGGQTPGLDNLAELNRQRNRLMAAMERDGITVRQGTHAVHTLGYYAGKYGLKPTDFPSSLVADRLSITLPLFAGINPDDQARVVAYLRHPERYF
ncbi:MAG: DegT/DnrJ/EryC1/StrS family aminotransferase [Desulfarculus sp.]|nr:DegT/DnrJ/EryC1/StrS family aminotransferase [Desulfarculus sp.]